MQGVLDARGRQSLSRLIFYVFIPSLTFIKLGASVDLHNMSRWWILPVNVLIRYAEIALKCLIKACCTSACASILWLYLCYAVANGLTCHQASLQGLWEVLWECTICISVVCAAASQ